MKTFQQFITEVYDKDVMGTVHKFAALVKVDELVLSVRNLNQKNAE